jgi:integrase
VLRRDVGFVNDGKSDAAMRRIQVLGEGVAVLRRLVVGKAPGDLVFTVRDGRKRAEDRKPWSKNALRDVRWQRIVDEAGLTARRPTPHWLRHTHVAVCVAAKLSLPEIQRRLGHEDISTTINIYGRMIEEMNAEAAERLGQLLTIGGPAAAVVAGEVVAPELN